jgi:hypothetical protein
MTETMNKFGPQDNILVCRVGPRRKTCGELDGKPTGNQRRCQSTLRLLILGTSNQSPSAKVSCCEIHVCHGMIHPYPSLRTNYSIILWRDNLLKDLMWFRVECGTVHEQQHPSTNHPPSWSWAWTYFQITFNPSTDVDDAEILKATVTRNKTENKGCSGPISLRSRVVNGLNHPSVELLLDSGEILRATTTRNRAQDIERPGFVSSQSSVEDLITTR